MLYYHASARPAATLAALFVQDAACEKLAELALNDLGMAGNVLREVVGCSRVAVAAADREDVVKAWQYVRCFALLCNACMCQHFLH